MVYYHNKFHMNILGIETSCDETAAAVVRDGREVLSSVVYTQIPLHQPYGGVVPEVASRAHVEKISPVVGEAMRQAGAGIDAVAVTYGPGLSPALIVGLNAAKGIAKGLGVPLVGINHIEANLCGTISMSNKVAGLKDSVVDGVTGLLYENDDPEGFCQKAAAVLHDKARLAELEKNARERALTMSWDAMAEKMEKVVEKAFN